MSNADTVRQLSQDLHRQYQELPGFLRWDPNEPTKGARDDRLLIDLHLEYLYNDFLLYRILAKRTNIQPERIISVSLEIMRALLSMADKTFEYPTMRLNVSWIVSNTDKSCHLMNRILIHHITALPHRASLSRCSLR